MPEPITPAPMMPMVWNGTTGAEGAAAGNQASAVNFFPAFFSRKTCMRFLATTPVATTPNKAASRSNAAARERSTPFSNASSTARGAGWPLCRVSAIFRWLAKKSAGVAGGTGRWGRPSAASRSAAALARAFNSAAGTSSSTRPARRASPAGTSAALKICSTAAGTPTRRDNRAQPPQPGIRPMPTSGNPITVTRASVAMRQWQASASS